MASRHCPYCGIEYFVSSQLEKSDTLKFSGNRGEIVYCAWSICPKCNKASFALMGEHFDSPIYFSYPPALCNVSAGLHSGSDSPGLS